jgi:hypothetical protein
MTRILPNPLTFQAKFVVPKKSADAPEAKSVAQGPFDKASAPDVLNQHIDILQTIPMYSDGSNETVLDAAKDILQGSSNPTCGTQFMMKKYRVKTRLEQLVSALELKLKTPPTDSAELQKLKKEQAALLALQNSDFI